LLQKPKAFSWNADAKAAHTIHAIASLSACLKPLSNDGLLGYQRGRCYSGKNDIESQLFLNE